MRGAILQSVSASAHYSAAALPGLAVPVCGPPRGFGVMPGGTITSLRLSAASISRSAPLSHDAHTHLRSHGGSWGPKVSFGRSCFRATPMWSTQSRREAGGWDALRFGFLTGASEPEGCDRIQTVVCELPGLPGNRTWAFVG